MNDAPIEDANGDEITACLDCQEKANTVEGHEIMCRPCFECHAPVCLHLEPVCNECRKDA
jgi:hypothetical protein